MYYYWKTCTFVIDSEKNWEEVADLMDIEKQAKIGTVTLPNGTKIVHIELVDMYGDYSPNVSISPSDKIIIGYTYEFKGE